jgi:hypothetical protein
VNWVIDKLLRVVALRKLAAPLVKANGFMKGHRTEIATALYVLTYVLEMVGVIPAAMADQIRTALIGAGLVTGADKLLRYHDIAEELVKAGQADPTAPK